MKGRRLHIGWKRKEQELSRLRVSEARRPASEAAKRAIRTIDTREESREQSQGDDQRKSESHQEKQKVQNWMIKLILLRRRRERGREGTKAGREERSGHG